MAALSSPSSHSTRGGLLKGLLVAPPPFTGGCGQASMADRSGGGAPSLQADG